MKFLHSFSDSSGNTRISPWVWMVLLLSGASLVMAVLLANLQVSVVAIGLLNPLSFRVLPELWQVQDVWIDVVLPLALAVGICLGVNLLPRRPAAYLLATVLLTLFAARYFIWRATTINTAHPVSLFFSLVFFLCEVTYLLTTALQFYPSLKYRPQQRRRQADQLLAWAKEHEPSVDIWIPTYNESERLIRRCILACGNIQYANKTIYVLDDGHRPAIAALAQELGVKYLSRPDNLHRKAGNLNYALAHSHGDLIAVFDCDFIPFSRFLDRTVGFFKDPKVALVQTPQHYFNSDFHNRNLGLDVLVPDDMDYFFHYVQVIRDPFNAVVCCGTSYLARRSALEAIGGYVTHCIVEDNQTGTRLLTRGWRMIYLDEVLSLGEVPRTFRDYLEQRLRWMQGNIQVFTSPKELPVWKTLNFWQKVFYLNLLLSLLTPVFRAVYIIFLLLSMLIGFTLIAAPPVEYMAYGLPFVIMLYFLPSWQTNGHYFHFWTEVYESLFCFPALKRMSQLLFRPFRSVGSLVTNKDVNNPRQTLDLRFAWPFLTYLFVFVGVLVLNYGLPLVDIRWSRSVFEGEGLMVGWNLYNGILMFICLLACIDKPIRRQADRFPLELVACLELGGKEYWGVTNDVSEQGASLVLNTAAPRSGLTEGLLRVPQYQLEMPVRLMRSGRLRQLPLLGLNFEMPARETEAALIQLIYGENAWFQKVTRVGSIEALFLLLGSVVRAEPILRRS
ncbi:glycosyltransferase [Cyanobium sp. N5-Cardenillas]|uniref:glycosyltransferase n=1 Tax=Cyanobium sp. N5-Cardenillas TaxID=2823720 RepID=UPI0020CF16A4|nr:glycosyltransferase [Cyanobium sp. N5-Cardenillas]MCP9786350.1 glycosyltransferase [Cyanobium sp. N5-Cardenillas]